jgi:two-component system LytT family response regulator
MRVLVVDDEPLARERIVRLLTGRPPVREVIEALDGPAAIEAIRTRKPDLMFLDVQMPGMDGFGVLRSVGLERAPVVVFVTAFDAHALRAFDVHAVDYLLKPYDTDRFWAAFRSATDAVAMRSVLGAGRKLASLLKEMDEGRTVSESAAESAAEPPRHLERIAVRGEGRIFFLRPGEVDWCESAGNYVKLHVGRVVHVIRETLSNLEGRLDPAAFIRIHRRLIVNLDRIHELQPWFGGDQIVILKDGSRLRLSRTFRERVAQKLFVTG